MTPISAQRALEALRNGVPNSDAVRALGCMQPDVVERFRQQLDHLAGDGTTEATPCVSGTMLHGDFGTGKSHTLSCLEQEAMRRNFVVSRIVISKETPLHDPAKMFLAAVREARLPNSRGSLLHELATGLDYRADQVASFRMWATSGQPLPMIAASVLIDERSHDAELKEQIVHWWSGEKLTVSQVRNGLRSIGVKDLKVNQVKVIDLTPARFEFAARLARARGFAGWVLLLDEVELIARFSLLQRARAYAELARWLGAVPSQRVPGMTVVAAITADYGIAVLNAKGDREKAPARLEQKGDQISLDLANMARSGIDLIEKQSVGLYAPSDDTLKATHGRLRELYSTAYGHSISNGIPFSTSGPRQAMRAYVRRWIIEWDLQRLYGVSGQELIQEEAMKNDYDEDPDSMSETEERLEPTE